jgi:hypothetical protein
LTKSNLNEIYILNLDFFPGWNPPVGTLSLLYFSLMWHAASAHADMFLTSSPTPFFRQSCRPELHHRARPRRRRYAPSSAPPSEAAAALTVISISERAHGVMALLHRQLWMPLLSRTLPRHRRPHSLSCVIFDRYHILRSPPR